MMFCAGDREWDLQRQVLVMGIVNVTPDSFSEHGDTYRVEDAVARGLKLVADGADILDIGGESTRPGAQPVEAEEEMARILPVIEGLRRVTDCPISVDTWKASVADRALRAGACMVNDISGFHRDCDLAGVAAEHRAGCIAMHMRGTPQTMQSLTEYADIFAEINAFFGECIERLVAAGVERRCISLDPGIGFSKTVEQNLLLIRHLDRFAGHGCPLLLGVSRKSFIGRTLKLDDPKHRVWGTGAAVACGILRGAHIVRVHDVREMRQVTDMTVAIRDA